MASPFISATSASASPSERGSWVYYPAPRLIHAKTIIVKGSRSPAGACTFSESGSGGAGSGTVSYDEVGYNAATCQEQYEVGTPVSGPESASPSAPSENSSSVSGTSGVNASKPVAISPDATVSYSDYQKNWYTDPAGISVSAFLQWTNATFVNNCFSSGSYQYTSQWWSPDGWILDSQGGQPSYNCGGYSQYAYAQMSNDIFCTGFTTYTHYGESYPSYDLLGVYYNGQGVWNFNDSVSGGCEQLLSHNHDFTAP